MRQQAQNFLLQPKERNSRHALAWVEHNVPSSGKGFSVHPEDLAQTALHPIAKHRFPQSPWSGNAQAAVRQSVRR